MLHIDWTIPKLKLLLPKKVKGGFMEQVERLVIYVLTVTQVRAGVLS
jgi:hypothetical protein